MSTTTLRFARPDEAPLLPAIERSAGALFRTLPDLAWIADDGVMSAEAHLACMEHGAVWVAETAAGELVGFLSAEDCSDTLHVWELSVHHDWQGQGIGRRLLAAAADHARARGLAAVTLTTFRDVPWNAPFYARLGFVLLTAADLARAPRLADILAQEARHGLTADRRCAMRLGL